MNLVPLTRDEANELVRGHHRHHGPVVGHRFAIGLELANELVGAVVVGRPVARQIDARARAEITRLVVREGIPNGCSKLYGAAWRAWRSMGGRELVTYTLPEEGGVSLRASGAMFEGEAGGGTWDRPNRGRTDKAPTGVKWRWRWSA